MHQGGTEITPESAIKNTRDFFSLAPGFTSQSGPSKKINTGDCAVNTKQTCTDLSTWSLNHDIFWLDFMKLDLSQRLASNENYTIKMGQCMPAWYAHARE